MRRVAELTNEIEVIKKSFRISLTFLIWATATTTLEKRRGGLVKFGWLQQVGGV